MSYALFCTKKRVGFSFPYNDVERLSPEAHDVGRIPVTRYLYASMSQYPTINNQIPQDDQHFTGIVVSRRPTIMVYLRNHEQARPFKVEALFDTGFTGVISLPKALVTDALEFTETFIEGELTLADDSKVKQMLYQGEILFPHKGWGECFVHSVSQSEVLVGMGFFKDCTLILNNSVPFGLFYLIPLRSDGFLKTLLKRIQIALAMKVM